MRRVGVGVGAVAAARVSLFSRLGRGGQRRAAALTAIAVAGTFVVTLALLSVGSAAAQSLPGVPPSWLRPPVVAPLSPAALVARTKSADQFRGESAAAALGTAQAVFPGLMSAPVWRGPSLPPGSHVHAYLSSTSAQVAAPNTGRFGLLESSTPLLGHTPSGQSAPVDLGLVAGTGGFVPVSAAVAVQIPASTAGPVVFPGSGIAVGLPGVGAAIKAVVSKDRAYYASVSADEDVSVNAMPQGAEVSVLLRSPAATTTVPLSFALPSGATLRLASPSDPKPQPPGSVVIEQGTSTIGLVGAASGRDAQGQTVSSSRTREGLDDVVDACAASCAGRMAGRDRSAGVRHRHLPESGEHQCVYVSERLGLQHQRSRPGSTR